MLNIKNRIIPLILFLAFLVGCTSGESIDDKRVGYLDISIESETKAVSTDNFVISIYSTNGNKRVFSSIFSLCPDLIELEVGGYVVGVRYPSVENYRSAKFEQPLFEGQSSTTYINENQVTTIQEIPVSIQNMLVSVEFNADLKNWFSEYSAEVSINDGADKLAYNSLTTTIGYFSVMPLTVKFRGVRIENKDDIYEKTFDVIEGASIKKAAHHKIMISADYAYPTRTNSNENRIVHHLNL